jgi:hypothetical protein
MVVEKSKELHALLQSPFHHFPTHQHLTDYLPDLRRPEIKALVEFFHSEKDFLARQVRITDSRGLGTRGLTSVMILLSYSQPFSRACS